MAGVSDPTTGVRLERPGLELVPPGQPTAVQLSAPAPVPQVQIVDTPFSLTWIQKNVVFNSRLPVPAPIEDNLAAQITGGVPVNLLFGNAAVLPAGTVTPTPDQAAGIVHQVHGVLPVAIPLTPPQPVLSVRWRVCKPSQMDPSVCELDESEDLQLGVDYLAPDGLGLDPTFVFGPRSTEDFGPSSAMSGAVPIGSGRERWLIRADASLTVASSTTVVPPLHVPIEIPALAIPTLALFCTRPNFEPTGSTRRALLLLVPRDSALAALVPGGEGDDGHLANAEAVQTFLEGLRTTLVNLASVGGAGLKLAAFLLGLQRAVNLIRTYRSAARDTYVRFRVAHATPTEDGVRRLDLIVFPGHDFEDTVSSLLFIGPKGRVLECFQGREFNEGADRDKFGQLNLLAREQLFVAVGNLRVADPVGEPPSGVGEPPATEGDPTVVTVKAAWGSTFFDDVFSSVRFSTALAPQGSRPMPWTRTGRAVRPGTGDT